MNATLIQNELEPEVIVDFRLSYLRSELDELFNKQDRKLRTLYVTDGELARDFTDTRAHRLLTQVVQERDSLKMLERII